MPLVSSDAHAHLRPIFRQLSSDRSFTMLATEVQFTLLVDAVSTTSEHHAALMRQYSTAARAALIGHLARAEQQRPGHREIELWVMHKNQRVLACLAVYLPHGVDVRLLEGGDVRRTQLVADGPHAEAIGAEWLSASESLGWSRP